MQRETKSDSCIWLSRSGNAFWANHLSDLSCYLVQCFYLFWVDSIAGVGCKSLWNNKNIWMVMGWDLCETTQLCVSLKIIAYLRIFINQSELSIQQPHPYKHVQLMDENQNGRWMNWLVYQGISDQKWKLCQYLLTLVSFQNLYTPPPPISLQMNTEEI